MYFVPGNHFITMYVIQKALHHSCWLVVLAGDMWSDFFWNLLFIVLDVIHVEGWKKSKVSPSIVWGCLMEISVYEGQLDNKDCLIRIENMRRFLSELSGHPNYQCNISINGVLLCPEKLSKIGGLTELLVPELTDLYCTSSGSMYQLYCGCNIFGLYNWS